MPKAIITGILGQDAPILAEYLLSLNYEVFGLYKRVSSGNNFDNISDIKDNENFKLVVGDICDHVFMTKLIESIQPDEFYNLAAMSHVGHSFKIPTETFRVNAEAVIAQLDIIKNFSPKTKFYQANTSEMFGGLGCSDKGYDENSLLNPRSPYAVSKVAAHYSVKNYRAAYNIFACSGILFNHSSKKRGIDFATRKITSGIAEIKRGEKTNLYMGDLSSVRDEGHAKDFVKAMHLMLQQDEPDDYVVATGNPASIEEMFKYVCELANLKFDDVYRLDERFIRPSDVPYLKGNAAKIKALGWKPEYDWKKLLKEMFEHDMGVSL